MSGHSLGTHFRALDFCFSSSSRAGSSRRAPAGRRAAAVLVEVVQKVLAPLGVSGMIRAALLLHSWHSQRCQHFLDHLHQHRRGPRPARASAAAAGAAAAVDAGGENFLLAKGTRAILYHFEAAGFICAIARGVRASR
jgi:hypothetical protein